MKIDIKKVFWKKSYLWATLFLFVFSLSGHWIFGWSAYKKAQAAHNQPIEATDYVIEMLRDTFENWQSEFLQLIWQVCGLAWLYYAGSPSSKEGDERKEEKLDYIIRMISPKEADVLLKQWNRKYPKK
jgi:hypothetical protein